MRNKFFISCVAAIIFILLLCTLVGSNVTNESTDRLEKAINESDNKNTTVINNNYNNKYYDNSTTINNNIINSYNTDTDDNDIVSDNNEVEEKTNDDEEVYETEETIADENNREECREYNDYNTENNSSSNNDNNNDSSNNTITPIGDIKNDMDPDPNIVHIKNIKCPNCGAYSYIEHYNLKDENLLFYMGTCNSCGFER